MLPSMSGSGMAANIPKRPGKSRAICAPNSLQSRAQLRPSSPLSHQMPGLVIDATVHLLEAETRRPVGEGASRKRAAGVLHDPLEVRGRVTRRIDVVVGVDDPVLAARSTLSRRPARAESSTCADGREHPHDRTPRRRVQCAAMIVANIHRAPPNTFGHLLSLRTL